MRKLRMGVIVPSTNVVVEDEYNRMRVPDVSFHAGRIYIENESLDDDAQFEAFLERLRIQLEYAIRDVVTCRPDALVMGMSVETFWGGAQGADRFEAWVHERAGLAVTTGAKACRAALDTMDARRIGVVAPYQPVADGHVRTFFTDLGYDVARLHGLKCATATAIAEVPPEDVEAAFRKVDGDDVDALVQAGTNLEAVEVAARLEQELGKPVIAINAATLWHAYRSNGIDQRIDGFGSLLAEH